MTVMGLPFGELPLEAGSEALGAQQRVGQVEQQTQRNETGERVIENHGSLLSQPFAGVGVAYARREKAEAERQHDDVQHGMLLFAPRIRARQDGFNRKTVSID